ncbi:MAG: DNA polymerase IV, partial [Betaproteobacteria bacterium]
IDDLIDRFGESYGHFLNQAAHGIDDRPLVTHWEPKQRSRERTFQQDTSDWQKIAKVLAQLSRDVADELKEDGYTARTIGIKLRFANFETLTRDKTIAVGTDSPEIIRKAAFECLARVKLERPVRLLGVRAGGLEKRGTA